MTHVSDPGENYDIRIAEGLSAEQREEALRIFAGMRATRAERDAHEGEPGVPVPLCPVPVDDDGTPCMLPLPHDTHRAPEQPAAP
jgi:hypothetical protein